MSDDVVGPGGAPTPPSSPKRGPNPAGADVVGPGGAPTPPSSPKRGPNPAGAVRVGQGFDVHRFSDDLSRRLVLGGVELTGERGLAGHSDADVVAHAIADAVLGACGLGDLGQHFPDTDPAWAGADSLSILAGVVGLARDRGWAVGNVDCTVVLEAPKLAPYRDEMVRRLGRALQADVSVKATRAEGLGAIGRGEGVVCWAVALVERR